MAGIDVAGGGRGGRRATNGDINMLPFIDLLLCTIAFLLITAVWSTQAQVTASADIPGTEPVETPRNPHRVLHVSVRADDFLLQWKQGSVVISESVVPRADADHDARLRALAQEIAKQWEQGREHFDADDRARDELVLHSDNQAPFRQLVAVMDAANSTKRSIRGRGGSLTEVPAFNTTFAVK